MTSSRKSFQPWRNLTSRISWRKTTKLILLKVTKVQPKSPRGAWLREPRALTPSSPSWRWIVKWLLSWPRNRRSWAFKITKISPKKRFKVWEPTRKEAERSSIENWRNWSLLILSNRAKIKRWTLKSLRKPQLNKSLNRLPKATIERLRCRLKTITTRFKSRCLKWCRVNLMVPKLLSFVTRQRISSSAPWRAT